MSTETVFPKAVKLTADLFADKGSLTVNCLLSDGALYPALSPVECGKNVPQDVKFAVRSAAVNKFFICTATELYASDDGINFSPLCAFAADKPFLLEDMDGNIRRAIIADGANGVTFKNGATEEAALGAKLGCAAVHSGRIFGADADDGLKLRWSDGSGADGWTEGIYGAGWLNLDAKYGAVIGVTEFGASLVLVREYGLTPITAGGAPETFAVKFTDLPSDKIFKGTAAVAGGKLFFFTASGLHSFDGAKISEVKCRFAADIFSPVCCAALGNKYFLSCRSKTAGKVVFCYDTAEEESFIIGAGADGMCAADCVYVYNNGGVYKLEEGGNFKFTAHTDFGTGRKKTVTEVFIDCDGADIEISNGRLTRIFKNVKGIIRPRLRGKKFTVKVAAACPVKKLTATAEAAVGI